MNAADPRRPFVLFGLGYLAVCTVAVLADHSYRQWKHRRNERRRKEGGDEDVRKPT